MGRITGALVFWLIAAFATGSANAQETATFRADVSLVRLLVTVKDRQGAPAVLDKNNFKITDNGIEQQIAIFERHTEQPLSVSILIDTSGSTGREMKYEVDSVTRFARALFREGNPEDRAALYSFNWEVVQRSSYTRSVQTIEKTLKGLKSEGGTSMYDAIWLASREVEEREGRHVLIVVTDGGDTTSARTYHQALEAAQRADAVIYPILVIPIANDAGRNTGGENALTTLAEGTGGRVFAPTIGEQLDEAFNEILRDLRTQYLIGFYPKNVPTPKDGFHRLRVTVDKPGLRVQTRSGYYGDSGR